MFTQQQQQRQQLEAGCYNKVLQQHYGGHVSDTYLLFLLVKVVDDDTDEEIEREEGSEDDEKYEVEVHVNVGLTDGLFIHLSQSTYDPTLL